MNFTIFSGNCIHPTFLEHQGEVDLTAYVSLVTLCLGLEAPFVAISQLSAWCLQFFMAETSMTKESRKIILFKHRLVTP